MLRKLSWLVLLVALVSALLLAQKDKDKSGKANDKDEIVVVQISDTHLALKRAPDAEPNLKKAVDMIAAMNPRPDAVIVSGDLGENRDARDQGRGIIKWTKVPVYFVPGNHDDSWKKTQEWRDQFGPNYYRFKVGFVTFLGLDSQLLGNFDDFGAREPEPLPEKGVNEAEEQLKWLAGQANALRGDKGVVIAVQHVPNDRDGNIIHDQKPYWTTQEPWRSRAIDLLKKAGVKDVLAGHWHKGTVFSASGFTYHIGPATSWLTFGGKLGFAVHHIARDGSVRTEFVYLDGSREAAK